ncbi:MAG TPA: STING domain-containing protein [Methylomirabilota bacterium]|nr:STING domain-containing protein [Methylomirabilota bacterium]
MWEELAIKIGLKAVERFFDGSGRQDTDVISVGLAVGYYYNFLDPVSGVIKRDEFQLYASPAGGESRTFSSENVRVQIILPARLDVHAFQRCEEEFKALHRGAVLLKENNRYYGVNYALTELPGRTELTIVDLARPIMAAKRYYEDIAKLDTHEETNEKWLKIQVAEITAFKESLRRLQKRGYGGLVNKLDFRERA